MREPRSMRPLWPSVPPARTRCVAALLLALACAPALALDPEPLELWWTPTGSQLAAARNLGLPAAYQSGKVLGVALDFALVPAGSFRMGTPRKECLRGSDETPHQVALTRPFYVQATELTQGQYRAVLWESPSSFRKAGEANPVESVTWYDAVAFCNRLSEIDGLEPAYTIKNPQRDGIRMIRAHVRLVSIDATGYRLPTEAEWELAARAGTLDATYASFSAQLGEIGVAELSAIAVHSGNCSASYPGASPAPAGSVFPGVGTQPVAARRPNAFGLYDMLGNVAEWCWDCYGDYGEAAADDPLGAEPHKSFRRIRRGGNFSGGIADLRAGRRISEPPESFDDKTGLRLVRTAKGVVGDSLSVEQAYAAAFRAAVELVRDGKDDAARAAFEALVVGNPKKARPHYNLACLGARQAAGNDKKGQTALAMAQLEQALALGYSDFDRLLADTDLLPLRKEPGLFPLLLRFFGWRVFEMLPAPDPGLRDGKGKAVPLDSWRGRPLVLTVVDGKEPLQAEHAVEVNRRVRDDAELAGRVDFAVAYIDGTLEKLPAAGLFPIYWVKKAQERPPWLFCPPNPMTYVLDGAGRLTHVLAGHRHPNELRAAIQELVPAKTRAVLAIEAESLAVLSPPAHGQALTLWAGWHDGYSRCQTFWWIDGLDGDKITLVFDAPAAGVFDVTFGVSKSWDNSIVRLTVNGRKLGDFDTYHPFGRPLWLDVKRVEVKATQNELLVELVGRNPVANGTKHRFGLDTIEFFPPSKE